MQDRYLFRGRRLDNMLKANAEYRKTPKGVLTNIYHKMNERSKNKGYSPVTFTLSEFHDRYLPDTRFKELFNGWVDSDFAKSQKPSFDRLNPLHGYSLDNIQLMTWGENRRKADWEKSFLYTTSVDMLDGNGRMIRSFESVKEANQQTGIGKSLIIQCCQGRIRSAKGYVFHYRGDKQRTRKTNKYLTIHTAPELMEGNDA